MTELSFFVRYDLSDSDQQRKNKIDTQIEFFKQYIEKHNLPSYTIESLYKTINWWINESYNLALKDYNDWLFLMQDYKNQVTIMNVVKCDIVVQISKPKNFIFIE